jgi:hypothetical protein
LQVFVTPFHTLNQFSPADTGWQLYISQFH